MRKIIFILLIIFVIKNFYINETFSNSYQDTEILAKMNIYGTNLIESKPTLTLYFDRRNDHCKYFYDYYSRNFGFFTDFDYNNDNETLAPSEGIRFQDQTQFSGKKQAWNQLKYLYTQQSDKFINTNFMNIEEIEVDEYNLYDFNNKYAYKIKSNGRIESLNEEPKKYRQYYKRDDFLEKIPFVTLTFLKHKDKDEIDDIITNKKRGSEADDATYNRLRTEEKYDIHIIKYNGIYSPNGRAIQSTLDSLVKFVEETYNKYLKVKNQATHQSRIGGVANSNHNINEGLPSSLPQINKCSVCSEFIDV